MKIFAFLPFFILFWSMAKAKVAKKACCLLVMLIFSALLDGCANLSNKLDKSPCACSFESINTRS